uniref:Secreted protein n=1 Tax=Panagrellus redivivus TaxID=6233 RepID=A0A7E4ZT86_PANRE
MRADWLLLTSLRFLNPLTFHQRFISALIEAKLPFYRCFPILCFPSPNKIGYDPVQCHLLATLPSLTAFFDQKQLPMAPPKQSFALFGTQTLTFCLMALLRLCRHG